MCEAFWGREYQYRCDMEIEFNKYKEEGGTDVDLKEFRDYFYNINKLSYFMNSILFHLRTIDQEEVVLEELEL